MMDWLRVCAHCASFFPPVDLFCTECWRKLFAQIQTRRRRVNEGIDGGAEAHYLWSWNSNKSLLHKMLLARKDPTLQRAQERLAKCMVIHAPQEWLKNVGVIVYPTRDLTKDDHTSRLAKGVHSYLGGELHPLLLTDTGNYKNLPAKERYRQRHLERKFPLKKRQGVLFVDDIFTSGATIQAAWRACGQRTHFYALVLAYKEREKA